MISQVEAIIRNKMRRIRVNLKSNCGLVTCEVVTFIKVLHINWK